MIFKNCFRKQKNTVCHNEDISYNACNLPCKLSDAGQEFHANTEEGHKDPPTILENGTPLICRSFDVSREEENKNPEESHFIKNITKEEMDKSDDDYLPKNITKVATCEESAALSDRPVVLADSSNISNTTDTEKINNGLVKDMRYNGHVLDSGKMKKNHHSNSPEIKIQSYNPTSSNLHITPPCSSRIISTECEMKRSYPNHILTKTFPFSVTSVQQRLKKPAHTAVGNVKPPAAAAADNRSSKCTDIVTIWKGPGATTKTKQTALKPELPQMSKRGFQHGEGYKYARRGSGLIGPDVFNFK